MPVDKGWPKRVEQLLHNMHKHHETKPQRGLSPETARQIRAILRTAERYPWGPSVVQEYLDNANAETPANLSPAQVSALHTRMCAYADATQYACGSPDTPPPS